MKLSITNGAVYGVRTFAQMTLPEQRVEGLKLLHKVGTELIRMFEQA